MLLLVFGGCHTKLPPVFSRENSKKAAKRNREESLIFALAFTALL
jgi:hypothetical protein